MPETIKSSLSRLADGVELTPAPLARLVHDGRKARRRRRTLLTSAACLSVVTVFSTVTALGLNRGPGTMMADPSRPAPTSGHSLAVGSGSLDQQTVPAHLIGLAERAAALVDDRADLFAASWYDPATDSIHVSYVSDVGLAVAKERLGDTGDLKLVQGPKSGLVIMQELREALGKLSQATTSKIQQVSIATDGNGGVVLTREPLTDSEASELDQSIGSLGFPVQVSMASDVLIPGDVVD